MAIAAAVSSNDLLKGVPENVLRELQKIKSMFTINRETLRTVTDKFVTELENGLSSHGNEIPMNITWATGKPTGQEQGTFITIDLGGTNLRVCKVELTEELGGYEITQRKFKLPVQLRQGTVDDLWALIADKLEEFLESQYIAKGTEALPLAFTFSYPVTQDNIRHGVLQRWTKGFNISGVEGHDVVAQLEHVIAQRNLPLKIVALVNDTTGTLMATAYNDPQVKIGSIFGTGCNAAYIEDCGSIPKIASYGLPAGKEMAINTEYGAFDNSHSVLPRNMFDETIDSTSPRPGQQTYEKMVAALYLGELVRLIIFHLHHTTGLFAGCDLSRLDCIHSMESSFLSAMEGDPLDSMEETRALFREQFDIEPKLRELKICRLVAEIVCTRAARLYACGIAAICKKKGIESCHVAVDGSAFSKYPLFKERAAAALPEILDWPYASKDLVTLCPAEDGSAVGAALIAALSGSD
ncbi:hexokinase [Aspergillus minisclerotigenes]|uniref:Phosphotransferase n=1 Tax=Aspergillus minisclerotigenes TaxID=656917 RepID=A0A5N6J0H3_9EURO|nr:hexokinase [Aspergillus minisclerotigenes]